MHFLVANYHSVTIIQHGHNIHTLWESIGPCLFSQVIDFGKAIILRERNMEVSQILFQVPCVYKILSISPMYYIIKTNIEKAWVDALP